MNKTENTITLTRSGHVTISVAGFKAWVGGNHIAYEMIFQPSTRSGTIGTMSIRESNSEEWLFLVTDVSRETFEGVGKSLGWHRVDSNTYARKPHYTRRRREHRNTSQEVSVPA